MQKDSDYKFYTLFAMLILVNSICSSILGARTINLSSVIPWVSLASGGILPFCLSFMLIDIVTNQYGYQKAKKLIHFVLICKIVMFILLYVTLQFPPSDLFHSENSYREVMYMILRAFWASWFGTLVAFYCNCYIFSKLYTSLSGKYLWFRCVIATSLGEIIYSLISTPILFSGKLTMPQLSELIFHNYSLKILFEFISLPFIYLIAYILNKYESSFELRYQGFETPQEILEYKVGK